MRTALVTGASSGIGQACAVALVSSGWRVLAGVRREGDAPEGTEEVLLDVTEPEQIQDAAGRVEQLDGLVNNAGIALSAPLELVPPEELRYQLEVNVVGQIAVTQALLPALRRARGRIVFVGSIAGRSALPFLGPYAASKHALEAVADSLRVELRPFGIHVSIVEPGTIKTKIWSTSAARAERLAAGMDGRLDELYGERIAAFRQDRNAARRRRSSRREGREDRPRRPHGGTPADALPGRPRREAPRRLRAPAGPAPRPDLRTSPTQRLGGAMGYAKGSIDEMGDGPGFRKVRRELGVTAFGVNAVIYPPGQDGFLHYHDEQDELYFVHRGRASFEVDGDEFELGPGGVVYVESTTPRRINNRADEDLVLFIVGGKDGYVARDGQLVDVERDLPRRQAFTASEK